MKIIHSHTDPRAKMFPAGMALRLDDGRLTLAVRSNGATTASFIELTRDELAEMHADIGKHLDETAPAPVVESEPTPKVK